MKISQREARRLKKRVAELEDRNRRNNSIWSREYVGGVHVATEEESDATLTAINTARLLGHSVVVTTEGKKVMFHAVRTDI